jgi:hypothetical protein
MKEVDQLLEDAALVESVYDAQGKRHRKSRTHGRTQTPAEVALRLLILKHVRNWSYDTLEREVRANLVYRDRKVQSYRQPGSKQGTNPNFRIADKPPRLSDRLSADEQRKPDGPMYGGL